MQDQGKQPKPEPAIKRALGHPKRLEIFGYLTQKGGADETELVEVLGLTAPTVRYHLSVLEDADLIANVKDRGLGSTDRYVAAA